MEIIADAKNRTKLDIIVKSVINKSYLLNKEKNLI